MIVAGIRNTQDQLGTLIQGDFVGPGNFIFWVASIVIIGSIGYIKTLETFSRVFLALIVVALFFSNKGFFAQFASALQSGTAKAPPAAQQGGSGGGSSGASSSDDTLSQAATAAEVAALFL